MKLTRRWSHSRRTLSHFYKVTSYRMSVEASSQTQSKRLCTWPWLKWANPSHLKIPVVTHPTDERCLACQEPSNHHQMRKTRNLWCRLPYLGLRTSTCVRGQTRAELTSLLIRRTKCRLSMRRMRLRLSKIGRPFSMRCKWRSFPSHLE